MFDRTQWLREQTDCGRPESGATFDIVAYLDGEPAGWCAVEPRTAYPTLSSASIPVDGASRRR